jgi:ribosome modulation factor
MGSTQVPWYPMGYLMYMYPHILILSTYCMLVFSFRFRPLYPFRNSPRKQWLGGWMGPRPSINDVERRKILPVPGLELQSLGHQSHSQSLYRLRYLWIWGINTVRYLWLGGMQENQTTSPTSGEHAFILHGLWINQGLLYVTCSRDFLPRNKGAGVLSWSFNCN